MAADTVELGVSFAPAYQRQGFAREALEAILDFVFGGLHKQRAIALVDPRNFRCMRLLEGLGMRRDGTAAGDVRFALPAAAWLAPPSNWADRG